MRETCSCEQWWELAGDLVGALSRGGGGLASALIPFVISEPCFLDHDLLLPACNE